MIRADVVNRRSLRRSLVRIVMAFDQHREQIAFDALDTATGEVSRGRIRPADRLGFRRWLRRWDGEEIEAALEATTGWRFMVEELEAVGAVVHLAEPAETSALRGPKRRAKTDRRDARRLRELLQAGRGAPAWGPPPHNPPPRPQGPPPPAPLWRRGPPPLRGALLGAPRAARWPRPPARDYYEQAADRLGSNRACLSIARRLLKRAYHTLSELGEEALQPA